MQPIFATCVQLMMYKIKMTFVIKIVAYVNIPNLALYIYHYNIINICIDLT
jgi:hypothetical protein